MARRGRPASRLGHCPQDGASGEATDVSLRDVNYNIAEMKSLKSSAGKSERQPNELGKTRKERDKTQGMTSKTKALRVRYKHAAHGVDNA